MGAITLYLFVRQRSQSLYSYGKTGQQLFGFPDAKSNPGESYRVRYPLSVSLMAKARCREKGKWNKFQVGRLRADLKQSSACDGLSTQSTVDPLFRSLAGRV